MGLLSAGDAVGIVACSDGLDEDKKVVLDELKCKLNEFGLKVVFSDHIFKRYSVFNGSGKERAEALMKFYEDKNIKAIFDVSGGNLANGVLDYLNFDIIKENYKPFVGYSDLSVVLNSLYTKVNKEVYLYQVRNLVGDCQEVQCENFKNTFMEDGDSLLKFNYDWIQGKEMNGVVVGGNIRCLLKLSGTEFIPDFEDKILLLESLGGGVGEMTTFLTQYKQQGILKKVKGIILGSYTQMEREKYKPDILSLVKEIVDNPNMPIIKTSEIGHGKDSKCIIIGKELSLT